MDDVCLKWGEKKVLSKEGVVTGLNGTFIPRAKVKRGGWTYTQLFGAHPFGDKMAIVLHNLAVFEHFKSRSCYVGASLILSLHILIVLEYKCMCVFCVSVWVVGIDQVRNVRW